MMTTAKQDGPLAYTIAQAQHYDGHRKASQPILDEMARALELDFERGPRSLLDLGCGSGNYLAVLAKRSFVRLAGVDVSAGMLSRARTKVPDSVELHQADLRDLPLEDKSFDAVMFIHSLHHVAGSPEIDEETRLAERKKAFAEAFRVLRPGGQLFLVQSDPWQNATNLLWGRYFPEALRFKVAIQPRSQDIMSHLVQAGFAQADSWTFADYETRPVFNPELALSDDFLPVYSEFSYLSPEALEAGRQRIRKDLEAGLLPELVTRNRADYGSRGGNFTAIWARRSSCA